jgi:hypothetical protein
MEECQKRWKMMKKSEVIMKKPKWMKNKKICLGKISKKMSKKAEK